MPRKNICETVTEKLVRYLAFFSLLSLSNATECEPPKGSYLKTCTVTGYNYYSSDPNLLNLSMCRFIMSCQKLDGQSRDTIIYTQKSMKGCLRFFENCDGYPIIRNDNERICTDREAIRRETIGIF